jgi:hypothetical protein
MEARWHVSLRRTLPRVIRAARTTALFGAQGRVGETDEGEMVVAERKKERGQV